ncbi:MAG: uracil-DNA glycosylase [Betaproteobacteria bacterium]|nr:uracil-DNA glycosylase [Betaproteobacteria bacterium]
MPDDVTDAILECRRCARLAAFLGDVRARHPGYHARPVPSFGEDAPRLLIVGLAPGLHGANRTGRPFTGDFAGLLLYDTLHRFGFANRAQSVAADDGLRLRDCRIANAVRCVPPRNKPTPAEIGTCNVHLARELGGLPSVLVILALGTIAHGAVVAAVGAKPREFAFGHGARHVLPGGLALFDSYHCSRYNTQTRRLTEQAFHEVFAAIREQLGGHARIEESASRECLTPGN